MVALLPKGTISSTEAQQASSEAGLKNLCPLQESSNTINLLNPHESLMWNDPSELARLPFQLHTSMYKDTQDPSECKFALSPGENSTFLIQTISARNLRIELRTSDDRSRASMGDHPLLASVEATTIVD